MCTEWIKKDVLRWRNGSRLREYRRFNVFFVVAMGWEEVGVSLKCEMSFKQCLCAFCVIEIDLVMKTTMDVFV